MGFKKAVSKKPIEGSPAEEGTESMPFEKSEDMGHEMPMSQAGMSKKPKGGFQVMIHIAPHGKGK